jgi:hypothetical protein
VTLDEAVAFVLDRLPRPRGERAYAQHYWVVCRHVEATNLSPDALVQVVEDVRALDLARTLDSAQQNAARRRLGTETSAFNRSEASDDLNDVIQDIAAAYRDKHPYSPRETYEGTPTRHLVAHIIETLANRTPPIIRSKTNIYTRLADLGLE